MKKHYEIKNTNDLNFFEKLLSWVSVFLFAILPILYSNNRIAATVTSKQYFFMGIVDILIVVWVWVLIKNSQYRLTKNNWLIIVPAGLFVISSVISMIFGADITTSLFSTIERGGGLIFTIHAFIFAIIIASLVRVQGLTIFKKISQAILFSAVIVAIMTFFTSEAFNIGVTWLNESAGGAMLGNSTIAGSYFIFALFLGGITWLRETSKLKKILYGIGMVIILLSPILFNVKELFNGLLFKGFAQNPFIIIGQARAAMISIIFGLIVAGLTHVIFSTEKKILKLTSVLAMIVIFSGLLFTSFQLLKKDSKIQNVFIEQMGPNRILFWGEAFSGIKERPIIGWGQENYKIVHQKYFNPLLADSVHGNEIWVDKPHNSFIEITVSQGVIGILFYIGILVVIIYALILLVKRRVINSKEGGLFIGLLAAYILQNQFAFDSIISTTLFFTIIGVISGLYDVNTIETRQKVQIGNAVYIGWAITIIMIPVWVLVAYLPSRKMIEAKKIFDAPIPERVEKYKTLFFGAGSIPLNTDLGMIYYTLAESYLAQRYEIQKNPEFVKQVIPELQELINAGEKNKKYAQNDYKFMLAMAIFQETEIGIKGTYSQEQFDRMYNYVTNAINLSPTNPYGYLIYSKVLLYSEKIDEARTALDTAIALNPNIKESHTQKNDFERVFGTKQQQQEALLNAQKYIPGYQFDLQ